MQIADCYLLGKITKKHGYKGGMVLFLDTDEPETYYNLESIWLEENGLLVPFFISEKSVQSTYKLIIKLEGLDTELAIEKFINQMVYLPLSSLPKLSGNKFYYHEIIGFDLIDSSSNQNVGKIKNVLDQSAQTLLEVQRENQNNSLIPMVNHWLVKVDREQKQLLMNLPDGLLSLA